MDISTAFTSLAVLNLLSDPLSVWIKAVPNFSAALSCLSRVGDYLAQPEDANYGGPAWLEHEAGQPEPDESLHDPSDLAAIPMRGLESAQVGEQLPDNTACPASVAAEIVSKTHRRSGDLSLYLYYGRTTGWLKFATLVILVVAMTFAQKFQGIQLPG